MPAVTYPFVESLVAERTWPGSRTLDIGCGASQYRPAASGSYVGVDLPGSDYGALPDVLGDGADLPFRSETFDLVFGVATFYLIENAGAAFRDCRRVLVPDGRLLVLGYQQRVARQHQQRSPLHRHPWSFTELRDELTAAGFGRIEELRVVHDHPGLSPAGKLLHRLRSAVGRGLWFVIEARL